MSFIPKGRSLLRTAAVGGALIGTLVPVSAASAALGGATPATFNNRPNLQSVTFDQASNTASFNFDKPVQQTAAFASTGFRVGGYESAYVNNTAAGNTAVVDNTDARRVLVTYDAQGTGRVEFNSLTFGTVAAGVVQGLGTNNNPNLADSAGITGATGENGTRGRTNGPDLLSASVDTNTNTITYTFDQQVEDQTVAFTPDSRQFGFVDVNGNIIRGRNDNGNSTTLGGAASSQGPPNVVVGNNTVRVRFPLGNTGVPANLVSNAVQAFVDTNRPAVAAGPASVAEPAAAQQPIYSRDLNRPGTPIVNVPITGQTSTTVAPSLVSASLNATGGTIDMVFDSPVKLNANAAPNRTSDLTYAVASNGTRTAATSVEVVGVNTLRATFTTSQFAEHLVAVSLEFGAVLANNSASTPGIPSGKPIGGNAGAKATGYTTAPDAVRAQINRGQGQVAITFDSRTDGGAPQGGGFILRSANGTIVAGNPQTASVQNPTLPGPSRVLLQYTLAQAAAASSIEIDGNVNTLPPAAGNRLALDPIIPIQGTIPSPAAPVPTFNPATSFAGDNIPVHTMVQLTDSTEVFRRR